MAAKGVLIIGATSAIAQDVAKLWAKDNNNLFLAARNQQRLNIVSQDLKTRFSANVETYAMDMNDFSNHQALLTAAENFLNKIDVVLIAHGSLSDQKNCELSVEKTFDELSTNFLSVISLLTLIANKMQHQKSGCIAVISSVAGDRGRQSNYIYGTAKGALNVFLQGLRNRLFKDNVAVVTIKPGFVDTPMTKDFKKGLLWSQPEQVAQLIVKAIDKRQTEVYVPGYWRWIMCVVKSIPERVFQRLNM